MHYLYIPQDQKKPIITLGEYNPAMEDAYYLWYAMKSPYNVVLTKPYLSVNQIFKGFNDKQEKMVVWEDRKSNKYLSNFAPRKNISLEVHSDLIKLNINLDLFLLLDSLPLLKTNYQNILVIVPDHIFQQVNVYLNLNDNYKLSKSPENFRYSVYNVSSETTKEAQLHIIAQDELNLLHYLTRPQLEHWVIVPKHLYPIKWDLMVVYAKEWLFKPKRSLLGLNLFGSGHKLALLDKSPEAHKHRQLLKAGKPSTWESKHYSKPVETTKTIYVTGNLIPEHGWEAKSLGINGPQENTTLAQFFNTPFGVDKALDAKKHHLYHVQNILNADIVLPVVEDKDMPAYISEPGIATNYRYM